jgi:hypothetical protein
LLDKLGQQRLDRSEGALTRSAISASKIASSTALPATRHAPSFGAVGRCGAEGQDVAQLVPAELRRADRFPELGVPNQRAAVEGREEDRACP